MPSTTEPKDNYVKGILFILGAAFCFAAMAVFVKLSGDLPVMQKSFFRNLVSAGAAALALGRSGEGFRIRRKCLLDLVLRSAFGTLGILGNYWAIDHMNIADANMLNKLSPFFAIIMSVVILKEVPSAFEWGTVAVAFIGAVFVIRPTAGAASLPALAALLGAFGAGTAYTYIRKLSKEGERGPVIVLFFSLFSCLSVLPFVIAGYEPMTLRQVLLLLGAGLFAAGGQFTVTAAYRYAPAREISIFDYSQILWAALFSFFIFGTLPDAWSFVGYAIIIGTAVVRWSRSRRSTEA